MFNDGSGIYVVVGGLVTVMTGFYGIAKVMLSQATRDRDADRQERKDIEQARVRSNAQMAKAFERVATATESAAVEAKQRNGHLGEIASKTLEMATKTLDRLDTSASTLAVNTDKVATAVEGVKTTLEHNQS